VCAFTAAASPDRYSSAQEKQRAQGILYTRSPRHRHRPATLQKDRTRRHKDSDVQPRALLGTAAVMTGCLNSVDSGCLIGQTQVLGVQLVCRASDQAIANTATRALLVV
jgi:hypothetical protein